MPVWVDRSFFGSVYIMSRLDSGDFWVGSGGFRWFWVVWGGFRWFRVGSDGFGWFHVLSITNAQYMHKICARLYFFLQCAIYVQDLLKIVLISSMRNICTRFAQDCTYFLNTQYMHKICTRLYLFLQCAIYAQDLRKIVLISSMHNMHKIWTRLYLFPQCAIYAQDLCKIILNF